MNEQPNQPASEHAGALIGRYRLLEQIGEGGMGTIWMAEQLEPVKRHVALKVIKLGMDTREVIARFDAERQALAMMDHPHIARVFDAGATEAGRPYFVMEYIQGVPILEYCDRERLDTRSRLELFTAVCHAIQHAHQKGIIHRDIKPSNVLVTLLDGVAVPKVIDFGIAKATHSELTARTRFTELGQMIGTPAYMSPEQAGMVGLDIDTRSDIYSLGVLLYELLTGTTPFDIRALLESGFNEMLRTIREVEPPKPSTRISSLGATGTRAAQQRSVDPQRLGAQLRGDLDWIVMKCLEKERSRRYETANGLAADILRHLHDEPVTAGAPSAGYRLRKFVRRNRVQVLAASAVAAALLIGIVAFAWQAKVADEQRAGAELAREAETEQRKRADAAKLEAEAEATEARKQAAIAVAIAKFQAEMLSAADPRKLLGDKVTVAQAIDAAVARLDAGSLADQPFVESRVRSTIGDTLLFLGRLDGAERNLRKALEIQRAHPPADPGETAATLNSLAIVLGEQGEHSEAELMIGQALQIERAVRPTRPEAMSTILSSLAQVLMAQRRLEEAEPRIREALEFARAATPPAVGDEAMALHLLSKLFYARGQAATAEPFAREALAIMRASLPDGHPEIAAAIHNLATVLVALGKFEDAEPLLRESLENNRASLPAGHPDIASALYNLASVLEKQHRLVEAEPLIREALDIRRRSLPHGHPHTISALQSLGTLLLARNKRLSAKPILNEALELARANLSPEDPVLSASLMALASVLLAENELAQAELLFHEALQVQRAAFPVRHPELAPALSSLAVVLRRQGKLAEAEPLFREALEIQRASLPPGHRDLAGSLSSFAGLLRDRGERGEAESLYREALAICRATLPSGHPQLALVLNDLAVLLTFQGRSAEAEPLCRESLEISRSALPDGHPSTGFALYNLGRLLQEQDKREEAESVYREALAILRALPRHPGLASLLSSLGTLLQSGGAIDEPESLFREALAIRRAAYPGGNPEIAQDLNILAEHLLLQDKRAEAESLLHEALEIAHALVPTGHSLSSKLRCNWIELHRRQGNTAEAVALLRKLLEPSGATPKQPSPELAGQLALLGYDLLSLKQWGEAEALLRESLAIREKAEADAWTTFNTRSLIGGALLGQGKYAEAEPLLLDGYRGMMAREASIPPQAAIRIPEALGRLVQLYEVQGNTSEAAAWRGELEAARARLSPASNGDRK